jgi:hypothetical protein
MSSGCVRPLTQTFTTLICSPQRHYPALEQLVPPNLGRLNWLTIAHGWSPRKLHTLHPDDPTPDFWSMAHLTSGRIQTPSYVRSNPTHSLCNADVDA